MNEKPQTLEGYLNEHFGLRPQDLNIRMEKVAANASRYSKEGTLPDNTAANMEEWLNNWADEVRRSETEDDLGCDREGQDQLIAESMYATRQKLLAFGDVITLNQFPFDEILPTVRPFIVRALQKEIAQAVAKTTRSESFLQVPLIYTDDNLSVILNRMFGVSS